MTPWWVPLAAALVATAGALLAGDLLTARARLRRTLDKESAIHDRLPDGTPAKERLARIIERQSWELIIRTENAAATRKALLLLAFALAFFVLSVVQLRLHIIDPQPEDQPELIIYTWPLCGAGFLLSAVWSVWSDWRDRKALIEASMQTAADVIPTEPVFSTSDTDRQTTQE